MTKRLLCVVVNIPDNGKSIEIVELIHCCQLEVQKLGALALCAPAPPATAADDLVVNKVYIPDVILKMRITEHD
jgi:hypothetical protein